ncbi:MAG: hypothetical protein RL367_2630 [Pseudomonadota bacterium]|jgi:hypothetical protein
MADFEELSFVIPGYTPETMPLGRLIEYLQKMAIILGDPDNLHLVALRQGSCAPVFHAPRATVLEASDRAGRVARGDGTKKQVDAYNHVRKMLRRDARDAGQPAVLRSPTKTILEIPAAPDDQGELSGVRQASSIDGQLMRVGGAGEDASLLVQDLEGRTLSGFTTSRSLARELGCLLYQPVRLSGIGQWARSDEGEWMLERMHVQSYESLDDEGPGATLERLRRLNVKWPAEAADLLADERDPAL